MRTGTCTEVLKIQQQNLACHVTSVVITMTYNCFSFQICKNEGPFLNNLRTYNDSLSKELGTDIGGPEKHSSNTGKVGGLKKWYLSRKKSKSDLRQVITMNGTIYISCTLILCLKCIFYHTLPLPQTYEVLLIAPLYRWEN